MKRRVLLPVLVSTVLLGAAASVWVATPDGPRQTLPPTLEAYTPSESLSTHSNDSAALISAFKGQAFRSFCGPASIATVKRAFGDRSADQQTVFPSWLWKVKTFYTGLTLQELSELATQDGLANTVVYADSLSPQAFNDLIKKNLATEGDYVVVNFDRRVLGENGIGHFSPIASYDSKRDAYLVLDEADYKYPFTWVPAELLFKAAHTRDGDHYRGLLLITKDRAAEKRIDR